MFGTEKLEWLHYQTVKNFEEMTDLQTPNDSIGRTMHSIMWQKSGS